MLVFDILISYLNQHIDIVIAGIVSGLSLLMIIFIFLRPWIYISKQISREGNTYKFKIINFTPVQCTDVGIYLRKVKETDAYPKGKDVNYTLLRLNSDSFIYVDGIVRGFLKPHKPNCLQVKYNLSDTDIEEIVKANGEYVELIVKARHGMSNLQITRNRTYKHVDYIKNGKFKSGLSCTIS